MSETSPPSENDPIVRKPAGSESVEPGSFDSASIDSQAIGNGSDDRELGSQIDVISDPYPDPAAGAATKPFYPTGPLLADAMDGDWATPSRRVLLPLVLFVVTCFTTFITGCFQWLPIFVWSRGFEGALIEIDKYWQDGLIYMSCVMFALLCHEMGHFLMTLRHKVHASYPYFIPFPVTLTGTMGAVIGMEHSKANRKELFDIGIAGPLAGLVPTMIFVVIGILVAGTTTPSGIEFGDPLIVKLLIPILRPDLPAGHHLVVNPFYMAGWVGMLVTGLNMLPVSQLDGGHVGYAVLGPRWGRTLARAFVLFVAGYFVVSGNYAWVMMFFLVVLMGVDHPPTSDDTVELGWFRRGLGLVSLSIPIFCFTPIPLSM